ncbi:DNA-binding protein [Candidatus Bathyarchaeota archaeon]|nr:Zn-ribbon domain-containing OB-fold protein [Candidatus Bathyarchaeota archaeon]NIU81822.1 DNA-binding protein [Candidatus Bathyarchaeota archaeon]NIV67249.1 DNA-binding protein [Candidatus Bathyarchaeota archaeon]NIW16753.1 DNA-binding protein [Candidatus Bathyarchaeota archaeon]NIW34961.1 DNA-binding protein [Candidatus Bathyarchaeota archaeon]
MSFENFGRINYITETKVADFVEHLQGGEITATRCKKCGSLYFPPRADCTDCLSSDVEYIPLSGKGKVITFTTAHFAPVGFEAPYTLVLAELEEGLRVFTRLSDEVEKGEIRIGMKVKLFPKKLDDERVTYELKKA